MCWLAACESSPPRAPAKKDAAPPVVADALAIDAAPADAAGPPRKVFVHGAGRCGECHEKMFDEWESSAHSKAMSSPIYKAAVAAAKDPSCAHCHAPLAAALPNDLIPSEGITCDVCHTLRDPAPSAAGAGFRLAIDDMIKFGPRCDLKNHYFHRMGCSPEHRQAEICGACHWWERKGIPVFTEYPDWKAGPDAKPGAACQDCHMPKERAALATGSPVRAGVPHHGLLGLAADLRKRALALEVAVKDDAGTLEVAVTVTNAGAGHTVPAGLPERRLVVRVHVKDAAGAELEVQSRALGRVLVDASGAEVPFWRATKVGSDTRILPGAAWHDTFAFHPPGAGTVDVEVVYRALPEAIAKELGVPEIVESAMTGAKVPFGAPGPHGRPKLPKTVTVKPAAAGPRPHGATP